MRGCAIIKKFIIKVYDPSYHWIYSKFAPEAVQLLVGNEPDVFNYASPIFKVN